MPSRDDELLTEGSSEEDTFEKVLTAVTPDLYGATLVHTVISLRDAQWGGLCVAWFRHFLNIFFQIGITSAVWQYINTDKFAAFYPVETKANAYTVRLHSAMDDATAPLNVLNATDAAIISLCETLPHPPFLIVVWFLWSAKIITELSATNHFFQQVMRVPVHSQLRIDDTKDDGVNIMGLTNPLKALFIGLIGIPKVLIGIVLWWAGAEFLAMATDMSSLILKIFTLQFVLTLDELLFMAFIAKENRNRVKSSKVNDNKVASSPYHEGVKFLLCASLVGFAHWYFLDIQHLRSTCWQCVRDCSSMACAQAFSYCPKIAATALSTAAPIVQ